MKKLLFIGGPPFLLIAVLILALLHTDQPGSSFNFDFLTFALGIPFTMAFSIFWVAAVGLSMMRKRSRTAAHPEDPSGPLKKAKKWDTPLDHFAIALICYSVVLCTFWYFADTQGLGLTIVLLLFGLPFGVVVAGAIALGIHFFRKKNGA